MAGKMTLSAEQKSAAGSFGTATAVSAAAGSGKTTVLVERYLEAVTKRGAWPENILAVTFTDKAANVMKERVRRRCRELGLHEVGRRLDGAWIGTIHSFCARVLKENPIECGIDPSFSVLGAGEADLLMDETLDRLFEEEASNALFVKLLADAGEDSVRAALKAFYDKCRAYAGEPGLLRRPAASKELENAEAELVGVCGRVLSMPASDSAPDAKLREACRSALEALKKRTQGWDRFGDVLRPVRLLNLRSPKTRGQVEELKRAAEVFGRSQVQVLAGPLKDEWRRLVGRFSEKYDGEKRKFASLDFDDLLYFTFQALSGVSPEKKALRARLQRQFSHLFVDEYQDTSLLQSKILDRIKNGNDSFMVGDLRQSIYRFRHANPQVFLDALKRSRPRSLAENYRSRPEILEIVNHVSGALFGPSHEPLVAKRTFKRAKAHCLEAIVVPKDERNLDPLRVLEARTIAARVREMVESGFEVEEGGSVRPVRYRDFALLLRKTGVSRFYEKEFEAFSVPYFVNKGRGFYEKIEVADLVNFLRVLENPSENLAMAAVLRSPLAQISDDALYWLSAKRLEAQPEVPLGAMLARSAEIPELSCDDRKKIDSFRELWKKLREQKDRWRISELLSGIVEETAYEAKLLTQPGGRQARANVWKLIEMASGVEDKSLRGVSDFIRYLRSVSEVSETEAEAKVLGENEDVLSILTVHAAKGLEFPCVILGDMGGGEGKPPRSPFLCSIEQGLGARLMNPEDLSLYEDGAYASIVEDEKRKNAEESDRLLYVAMTRTQEHLILAGVLESGSGSWMDRLMPLVEAMKIPVKKPPVAAARPAPATKASALITKLPEADEEPAEAVLKRLEPVSKPYEALEDLSVSQLLACLPAGRTAAVPKAEIEPEESLDEEEALELGEIATPRNEFGTVFHLLMELGARQPLRGPLPKERVRTLTATLTADERKEIQGAMEQFWKSAVGNAVRRSLKCYPELPFLYKTRQGILKGVLDLVFCQTGGEWVILDYKTNRFNTEAEKEAAVKIYAPQLGLYALAFWKLYGEVPSKTLLYFTQNHEVVEVRWTQKALETLAVDLEEMYRTAVSA